MDGFLTILDQILSRMAAFNVRLKCSFGMQSIEFLGHIFDENGVNFIKGLLSHLFPLTQLTKKNSTQKGFEMTEEARDAFFRVKDRLFDASQLVIMNETDPFMLYTDAST